MRLEVNAEAVHTGEEVEGMGRSNDSSAMGRNLLKDSAFSGEISCFHWHAWAILCNRLYIILLVRVSQARTVLVPRFNPL